MTISKGELILLKYMNGMQIDGGHTLPNYFMYQYGIDVNSADMYIQKFIKAKLLVPARVSETLKTTSVADLKSFLTSKGMKVKGKKADLLDCLTENFSDNELSDAFPPRKYVLTQDAVELLESELNNDDYDNRYVNLDFDEIKAEIQKLMANMAYEKTALYTANPYSDLPDYVLKHHKEFICTAIYVLNVGSRSMDRILKRIFDIEDTEEVGHRYVNYLRGEKEIEHTHNFDNLPINLTYTIKTMDDSCTCDFCRAMSERKFNGSEAVLGVNYPPFVKCTCKYCRCYAKTDIE